MVIFLQYFFILVFTFSLYTFFRAEWNWVGGITEGKGIECYWD